MARSPAVVFAAGLAMVAGCGPSLTHVTPESPVAVLTVQVREFDLVTDPSAPDRPAEQMGASVAQRLVDALRKAGVATWLATASPARADLVLEGQVMHSDRGNRGLRYLGGLWSDETAGAARFAVKGRAVRSDGTTAGEFSASRRAGFGLFGGNSDTLFSNCIDAVAYDIAEMVISGQYQNRPDDTAFRAISTVGRGPTRAPRTQPKIMIERPILHHYDDDVLNARRTTEMESTPAAGAASVLTATHRETR